MELLIALGLIAVVIQLAIFFYGRKIRKRENQNNVLLKYNIKSRHDLWLKIGDPKTPEDDRAKLQKLYDQEK